VAVLPKASSAVTPVENAEPAVAFAGAVTVSREADAAATVIVALVPLMVPMTVLVAVTVRLPAWVRVTPFEKVLVPLSPATNV